VVRDLNRNLEIDPVDTVDPFLVYTVPAEQVTFDSLFGGSGGAGGVPTNLLGDDLNNNGVLDANERISSRTQGSSAGCSSTSGTAARR
jgi:hypothetical protein